MHQSSAGRYTRLDMDPSLKEPLDVEKNETLNPTGAPPPPAAASAATGQTPKSGLILGPINMKGAQDQIPASELPMTESPSSHFWDSHPGKFGTYVGFALVVLGMIASVISLKYAPDNVTNANWLTGCPSGFETSCKANTAVLRFSFALALIFFLQFLLTILSTRLYDSHWPFKIVLFIGFCVLFFYSDSTVFDQNGYAWFARIAGFFFVMLQQVILLDFALSWNTHLLEKAEEVGGVGMGVIRNKWLMLILLVSVSLFFFSYAAIGVMFHYFAGCADTNGILSITLILSVLCTALQMLSQEGSVLTSSIMTAYFTYVAFSAITLNPRTTCNPTLAGSAQTLSAAIGMAITVLSLTWTTHTTIVKIPASLQIVSDGSRQSASSMSSPQLRALLQEISVIFILISCYYAMVLTNWATLQANYSMASAKTGEAAMWLQASSIWVAALFYCWRLVAPRLFPDREF